jgi:hypothetical protein
VAGNGKDVDGASVEKAVPLAYRNVPILKQVLKKGNDVEGESVGECCDETGVFAKEVE